MNSLYRLAIRLSLVSVLGASALPTFAQKEYHKPSEIKGKEPYVVILDFGDRWTQRSLRRRRIDRRGDKVDFPYIGGVEAVSNNVPIIFEVRNINPFKFDVTVTSNRVDRFTESQEVFVGNLVKSTGGNKADGVFKNESDATTAEGAVSELRLHIDPPIPGTVAIPDAVKKFDGFYNATVALIAMTNLDQLLKTEVENSEDYTLYLLRRSVLNKVRVATSIDFGGNIEKLGKRRLNESENLEDKIETVTHKEYQDSYGAVMDAVAQRQLDIIKNLKTEFDKITDKTSADYLATRDFYAGLKTNFELIVTRMQKASIYLRKILTVSPNIAFGPVISGGDSVHFNVKVMRAEDNTKVVFDRKNVFTALPRNGWKIDFSPAIAFTRLFDREYTVATTDPKTGAALTLDNSSTPAVILQSKPQSDFNTAFTAQMHLYWKEPTWTVTPAFTTGIGFRNGLSEPVYMVGGSLLIGRDKRFVTTIGLAFGSVKDISKVPTNEKFATSILDGVAPAQAGQDRLSGLYDSHVRSGFFLSLGYNF